MAAGGGSSGACKHRCPLLLGRPRSANLGTALRLACAPAAGRLEVLRELERRGLDLRGRTGSAVLAAAVHAGAAPLVRWLLEERESKGRRCDLAAALEQVRCLPAPVRTNLS